MHGCSVAVVAINHNTREELRGFLESLGGWRTRTIVVDNTSTDGSAEMVLSCYPEVAVMANPVNVGYGIAANQAFRLHPLAQNASFLLLSNTDILLYPNAIEELIAELERHPEAGIAGPLLRNRDGSLQRSCFPMPGSLHWVLDNDAVCALLRYVPGMRDKLLRAWAHDSPRAVPWVKGAFMAIRRSAFEAVGGFDESYFMYYEETDLCFRLAKVGWQTRFTPAAAVVHLGGASTARLRAAMRVEQFISSMRFVRHHYTRTWATLVLALWKVILLLRLCRDRIRVAAGTSDAGLAGDVGAWRKALSFRFSDLERANAR